MILRSKLNLFMISNCVGLWDLFQMMFKYFLIFHMKSLSKRFLLNYLILVAIISVVPNVFDVIVTINSVYWTDF